MAVVRSPVTARYGRGSEARSASGSADELRSVFRWAFDAVDPTSRRRIEALFTGELAAVGVIDVAMSTNHDGFFTRRMKLLTDPRGPTFSPGERLATASPKATAHASS